MKDTIPENFQLPSEKSVCKARGFAAMDPEEQRVIATMGGQAVPDEKRSFSQNRRLAAEAGRKGGQSVPGSKRSFSQNRELAAAAGRRGGSSVPRDKRLFVIDPTAASRAGKLGRLASAAKRIVRLQVEPPDFLSAFSKAEITNAIHAVSTVIFAVGLTRDQFINLSDAGYEKLMRRYCLTEQETKIAWVCLFRIQGKQSAPIGFSSGYSNISALVRASAVNK